MIIFYSLFGIISILGIIEIIKNHDKMVGYLAFLLAVLMGLFSFIYSNIPIHKNEVPQIQTNNENIVNSEITNISHEENTENTFNSEENVLLNLEDYIEVYAHLEGNYIHANKIDAKIGDIIFIYIEFKNNYLNENKNEVIIRDILPQNLKYRIGNISYGTVGSNLNQHEDFFSDGIDISDYTICGISFSVEVIDENLNYGLNTITNIVQLNVNGNIIEKNIDVTITKE